MSVILCLVTCPSEDVASTLAKELVDQRLAACVNLVPGIQSIYRWKDDICIEQETLMIIKSTSERQGELRKAVLEKHPYEVPEFVALDTNEVSDRYAAWVVESVGHKKLF